jgi:hypothetical protein
VLPQGLALGATDDLNLHGLAGGWRAVVGHGRNRITRPNPAPGPHGEPVSAAPKCPRRFPERLAPDGASDRLDLAERAPALLDPPKVVLSR